MVINGATDINGNEIPLQSEVTLVIKDATAPLRSLDGQQGVLLSDALEDEGLLMVKTYAGEVVAVEPMQLMVAQHGKGKK